MLQCCRLYWRPARLGLSLFLRSAHTGKYLDIPKLYVLNVPPLIYLAAAPDSGLSPVLLTRARLLAAEHAKLSEKLAEAFDAKVAKRVGEIAPVTTVLKEWDGANESIIELKSLLEQPETDDELRSLAIEDLDSTREALPAISDRLKKALSE